MRRIVLTGSECTGKTTLAGELAAWLNVPWLGESARQVAAAAGRPLTLDDVGTIAARHMKNEDALVERVNPSLLVLDTDLISTVVYSRHYYGECPAWIVDEAVARRADLYLLARCDIPWTPDGVRDRPNAREELHELFRATLQGFGGLVLELEGGGGRRFRNALAAVRGWRAARPLQAT